MTDKEAKELLIRRYRRRGFLVKQVRRFEHSYIVVFGQDEKGSGLGPRGLSFARCNPPTLDSGAQLELPVKRKKRRP
ncbi:MAG: hypothetical protein V1495_06120 [Pseudomonadota bacterium]